MKIEVGKNLVELEKQKKVGVPVETYSRIVGYFRPVSNWNIGKQQEFKERNTYDRNDILKKEKAKVG